MAGFGIAMIANAYKSWQDNPVMTTISTPALPVEDVEYPAITICGLGSINELQETAFKRQVYEFLIDQGIKVLYSDNN